MGIQELMQSDSALELWKLCYIASFSLDLEFFQDRCQQKFFSNFGERLSKIQAELGVEISKNLELGGLRSNRDLFSQIFRRAETKTIQVFIFTYYFLDFSIIFI